MYSDSNVSEGVQQKVASFALLFVVFCLVLYTFVHDGCTRNGCTWALDRSALDEEDLKTLTDQELSFALKYRKGRVSSEQNSATMQPLTTKLIWQDVKGARRELAAREVNAKEDESRQQQQNKIDERLKKN